MSAQSLQVTTVVFAPSDLQTFSNTTYEYINNRTLTRIINATLPNYVTSLDLRTLSSNHAAAGSDIEGLLYTPDLPFDDPCTNLSRKYVPKNVTRRSDLPVSTYNLIALAPWINANCTLSYLAAARLDVPVQSFLFYLAENNNASTPPDPSNQVWNLGDHGNWKGLNRWPVYAIPGSSGLLLMQASAQYSGNILSVPNGQQLAQTYGLGDYVRLRVDIDTAGSSTTLPSIWLFLLVVLGILIAVMGLTSLLMHLMLRRRRQLLRRRVENGEIDLASLGIKHLTVPQELLINMPLYIYGTGAPVAASDAKVKEAISPHTGKLSSSANSSRPSSPVSPVSTARPALAMTRKTSYRPSPLQQPTCPICLDDFVPASPKTTETEPSTVRELPCHHIFHPECVDAFLLNNSSLCPMCKKSALPPRYCPSTITNAMVRRERIMRRIQDRFPQSEGQGHLDPDLRNYALASQSRRAFSGAGLSWLGGNGRVRTDERRISSAPLPRTNNDIQPMTELMPAVLRSSTGEAEPLPLPLQASPPPPPPATSRRREWARQRAVAMLNRGAPASAIVPDPDDAEAQAPAWRKALRGLFPALGAPGPSVPPPQR